MHGDRESVSGFNSSKSAFSNVADSRQFASDSRNVSSGVKGRQLITFFSELPCGGCNCGIEVHVFSSLGIAERACGSHRSLALLRWALVIIFLWFGGMKFTGYEANGIAPFVSHSPIVSWLHTLFGVQGTSYVIGIIELGTAVALVIGAFNPIASALGAAMSAMTFVITLTFFLSTPGVAEATAGGFPAISAPIGQFLLKDLVLLAASICLLVASLKGEAR